MGPSSTTSGRSRSRCRARCLPEAAAQRPQRHAGGGAHRGRAGHRHRGLAPRALRAWPKSQAWNFGIELRPEARGQGLGTEAQRLLAEFLFASYDLNRVEASTDVENLPEQALARKGRLRPGGDPAWRTFRAGAYHDLVTYARLREDPA